MLSFINVKVVVRCICTLAQVFILCIAQNTFGVPFFECLKSYTSGGLVPESIGTWKFQYWYQD